MVMDVFDFRERDGSGVDEGTESLAQAVISAAIEVHRVLKPGMSERSYKLALSHELTLRGIPHRVEMPLHIMYKGVKVGEGFIDILVDERLILELKTVESLNDVHKGQALGYLQQANLQLALLMNFNVALLSNGIKRVINAYTLRA
jgi:GxxExxY protein